MHYRRRWPTIRHERKLRSKALACLLPTVKNALVCARHSTASQAVLRFLSCNNTYAGADTTHALSVMLRLSLKSASKAATVNCVRALSQRLLAISNAVHKSVHRQCRTFKFMWLCSEFHNSPQVLKNARQPLGQFFPNATHTYLTGK